MFESYFLLKKYCSIDIYSLL